MDVTSEDFRQHFEMLSDAALLETNRDDLVDIAKRCFDEEVISRGLDAALAERVQGDLHDRDRLVRIAKFHSLSDIVMARALLRSADIPSHQGPQRWRRLELELPLMVPAPFAEEAIELLRSRVSDAELDALAEASMREEDPAGGDEPEAEPGELQG